MASDYSTELRIQLMQTGEKSGQWGDITNINWDLIESAVAGRAVISVTTGNNVLTYADGAADQARCAIIDISSATGTFSLFAPPVSKTYIIRNTTGSSGTLFCSTVIGNTVAAGAGYTLPAGRTVFVFTNGTQFLDAITQIGSLSLGSALAVSSGGTGASSAGVTAFNNITGYTASGATGTTSTNLVFSTSPTLTTPTLNTATLNTPALSAPTFSTNAAVTAGTNSQGQGALTSDYNVITTATSNPSGVTLPTATTGRIVTIVNKGANAVNVYPASGGTIDALSANAAISLPVNGVMQFQAASTTQWYSSSGLSLINSLLTAVRVSTNAAVTAGTNSQGQGALTSDYNIITTAASNPSGVTLPTATVGRKVTIVNKGANAVNVYPASGGTIDALSANASISLPINKVLEFNAASTTQWYSSFNASVLASGVSFTGTVPVSGQVAVYSDTTGNSISTSRTYQFRPITNNSGGAQIQLFEDPVNGTESIIIQAPAAIAATKSATYTLPIEAPSVSGYVLSSTTSGTLSWVAQSGGGGTGTITQIVAGNGMNFTTVNSGSATITMGTPGAITSSSSNSASGNTHTHAITGAAFLAGAQIFTGAKTFTGGITSAAYNFTAGSAGQGDESIYGSGTDSGTIQGTVTISCASSPVVEAGATPSTAAYGFYPYTTNSTLLGNPSLKWKEIYANNGTINTSDQNQKQDIAPLDDAEKRVAIRIKGLIKKYRFKDAVAKKGDDARIHVGVIAQEVRDAFIAEGLDANRYAMFCSDTWWEKMEERPYPPKQEMRMKLVIYDHPVEGATEVTQLGVRYDELLAFVIAAM